MPFEKYLAVMLATAIKFLNGPIAGLLLGLTWWETAICTIIGMMLTVSIIAFLGTHISSMLQRYRKATPKRFNRRTRVAVKVWQKVGIWGIACLTPLFFTPIGGTLLALSFRVSLIRILLTMLLFAVFWGIVLTLGVYQLVQLKALIGW